jgi:hypothetical protein
MPAWRHDEQVFAVELGAETVIIAEQQSAMAVGLELARDRLSPRG